MNSDFASCCSSTKASQRVKTDKSAYTGKCGKSAYLGASAKTALSYKSSDKKIATVSNDGKVSYKRPGTAKITITAAESSRYKAATGTVKVTANLARPYLKMRGRTGRIKLIWNQIKGADQVQLYVKFPGKKKYEKVMTRGARLKSVTHKGLKPGKVYRYKVRVRSKVNGKYRYSDFSNVVSGRAG